MPTKYVGTIPDGNNTAEKCVENLDDAGCVTNHTDIRYTTEC